MGTVTARIAPSSGSGATSGRTVDRRRSLPSGRAVVGGLLSVLAAIGTYLAVTTAGDDDRVAVAVAAVDLPAGHVLSPDDVRLVEVAVPADVRGLFGSADAAAGRRVLAPVRAGEFVVASTTLEPSGTDEHLELSLTLPASRVVHGLRPGQRVDVFSTWGGDVTELVAVDARVLQVGGSSSVLGGGDVVTVRLAVDDFGQIEALVHGHTAGDLTVIRAAIGTEVFDLGREYRPLDQARARSAADSTAPDGAATDGGGERHAAGDDDAGSETDEAPA